MSLATVSTINSIVLNNFNFKNAILNVPSINSSGQYYAPFTTAAGSPTYTSSGTASYYNTSVGIVCKFSTSAGSTSYTLIAKLASNGTIAASATGSTSSLTVSTGLIKDTLYNVSLYASNNFGANSLTNIGNLLFHDSLINTIAGNGQPYNFGGTVIPANGMYPTAAGMAYVSCVCFTSTQDIIFKENLGLCIIPSTNIGTRYGVNASTAGRLYFIYNSTATGGPITTDGSNPTGSSNNLNVVNVIVDSYDNIIFSDNYYNAVRMIPKTAGTYYNVNASSAGRVYRIAGKNTVNSSSTGTYISNTAPVSPTSYLFPAGTPRISIDSKNNLYIYFGDNDATATNYIYYIPTGSGSYSWGLPTTTGLVANSLYILNASATSSGTYVNNGQLLSNTIAFIAGLSFDSNNNMYYCDKYFDTVRMIPTSNGTYFGQTMNANCVYTIAGNNPTGSTGGGYDGDGVPATSTRCYHPSSIAFDICNNLFINDSTTFDFSSNRIRFVPQTSGWYFGGYMLANYIYTIAGPRTYTSTSPGTPYDNVSPLLSMYKSYPGNIVVDTSYTIYMADFRGHRVRKIS